MNPEQIIIVSTAIPSAAAALRALIQHLRIDRRDARDCRLAQHLYDSAPDKIDPGRHLQAYADLAAARHQEDAAGRRLWFPRGPTS